MKEIEPDELNRNDGQNGNPVYIACQGNVYDVTKSAKWSTGIHMMRHHAGRDLTSDIGAAPHGVDVLERYPRVGVLKKSQPADRPMPAIVSRLLTHYPMLRRHPHPMTVHFPIVFMLSAVLFTLLHLWTGIASWGTTAFHCLGAGILFMPVAMTTGYFTWWLNYAARPLRPVIIKQVLSWSLFIIAVVAFLWRLAVPDILAPFGSASAVYLLLILSLVPLVSVIGWLGGGLTFPVEKE